MISPSERLDDIAARHLSEPAAADPRDAAAASASRARATDARGAALASYLLFEAPYTRELIALGVKDTLERRDEVRAFFAWKEARVPAGVAS